MSLDHSQETVRFERPADEPSKVEEILVAVYRALLDRGYNPIHQMVGYLISGDPAYITSHQNARNLIRRVERDELMEELLRTYLAAKDPTGK
ncbi:MAG: IreB family regulatory phosphoprotein [Bacillota bacterium]